MSKITTKKAAAAKTVTTSTGRKLILPTAAENRKIIAAAKADPDAQPLTKAQLDAMVPFSSIRGRPKLESKKVLVSLRYSPEVIEYFRSTGAGWQARMDGVLRDYIAKEMVAEKGR